MTTQADWASLSVARRTPMKTKLYPSTTFRPCVCLPVSVSVCVCEQATAVVFGTALTTSLLCRH